MLKISAFGARELSTGGYKARLAVNWLGGANQGRVSWSALASNTWN